VVDTPGILDRALEDRNTIEMLAISALAHLSATVLFVVDISEQCGYEFTKQADLFHSIKVLFRKKAVFILCNKIDTMRFDELSLEKRCILENMAAEALRISNSDLPIEKGSMYPTLLCMSTLTGAGVMGVKQFACQSPLDRRVEHRLETKKLQVVVKRVSVSQLLVINPRLLALEPHDLDQKKAERKIGLHHGTSEALLKKNLIGHHTIHDQIPTFFLSDDIVPEIGDGHNITDFVDLEIDTKLNVLEHETYKRSREYQNIESKRDRYHCTRTLAPVY